MSMNEGFDYLIDQYMMDIPPEIMELENCIEILAQLRYMDMELFEFWYANLKTKTDFTDDEIQEWLEFVPDDEGFDKINEYIDVFNRKRYLESYINREYPHFEV